MHESHASLPSHEQELALHQRLLDGDHTATADLAAWLFGPLIQWLKETNPRLSEDICVEAAIEAMYALMKDPLSYKPQRKKAVGLFVYLKMSAQGDLQNMLRQENRHHRHRRNLQIVEQSEDAGKYLGRDMDPALPIIIEEETKKFKAQVPRKGLTERESRFLDLMEQGERRTVVFAQAYEITHLPVKEQRAEVKRLKDKLTKRKKRARPENDRPS